MRLSLLIFVLCAAAILGFLAWAGAIHFLYTRFFWFDIMMHALGGFVVGLAYLWWVRYEPPRGIPLRLFSIPALFVAVLLVGIAWEAYELLIRVDAQYTVLVWLFDTAQDIVMDMAGGAGAFMFFKRFAHE